MATINWTKIKSYYINHSISLRDLAKRYGVSYTSVANKSRHENWTKAKKDQAIIIESKINQKAAEKISDSEAEIEKLKKDIRSEIFRQIAVRMGREDLAEQDFRRLVQSYSDMINIEPEQAERQSDAFDALLKTIGGDNET